MSADGETYGTVAGPTVGTVDSGQTEGFVSSGQTVGTVDSGQTVGTIPRKHVPPTLVITNFSFDGIARTGITVDYTTSTDAKCEIFIRLDAGPGAWVEYSFEGSFHTTHHHSPGAPILTPGTWYNLYIHAYDASANDAYWPFNDPVTHGWQRFKTATRTDPGEEGDIMEG